MSDYLGLRIGRLRLRLRGIERGFGCVAVALLAIGAAVGLFVGYLIWGGA
jgi:hypothetical protein